MKSATEKQAVIIASRPVSAGMLKYVRPGAFVAAADAGWIQAQRLGLAVDLAVGDWDSAPAPPSAAECLSLPAEKDDTDTLFAAKELLRRGCTDMMLLGATGGRADHAFANLQVLLYLAQRGARACMADERGLAYCLSPQSLRVERADWRWLSVFAAGGPARGVCLRGVKYPLTDAVLTPDFPLGVSNEFAAAEAEVSFTEGYLYVWVQAAQLGERTL